MALVNSHPIDRGDYHRISPTARLVAYLRSFSDIPYAIETSQVLRAEELAKQIHQADFDLVTRFAGPFAEARYKCFNPFIAAHGNVLELAVGTSVERGLAISDDPDKLYIGLDLPEVIVESKAFLQRIDGKRRTNHHLEAANVLSYEELNAAASHFGVRRDLLIINEGLWMFLTTEEQVIFAENMRRLLEQYRGTWLTPDISDLESNDDFVSSLGPDMRFAMPRLMERIARLTGRELEKNYFSNRQEAIRFFNGVGFDVKHHRMIDDLDCLRSITRLWGERERSFYEPGLMQQHVWEMSLR